MIELLETIGTIAFAISGAMVGINKKMDILGVAVLGMTTAVGGGVVRDILIGITPPLAFQNSTNALLALGVSLVVFLPFFRNKIDRGSLLLCLIDSIGLGVFTVVGVKAGMAYNNLFLEVLLGTITGTGGGVIRDLFADDKPSIFVRHFYASACIIGAVISAILYQYNDNMATIVGILVIITLRLFAHKYKWNLPKA